MKTPRTKQSVVGVDAIEYIKTVIPPTPHPPVKHTDMKRY